MRKVLIIAYPFPPFNVSGVFRSAQFVKYLPQYGWLPYVVTTGYYDREGTPRDAELLASIPDDIKIWRVPTPRPRPVERLVRWIGWNPTQPSSVGKTAQTATPAPSNASRISFWRTLRRALLKPLYVVQNPPVDDKLYWALRTVSLGRWIARHEHIDVIVATAPPWSALLAGALISRLTRRPWVADFRDPWTDNSFIYQASGVRSWIDLWLERRLIEDTDAVISVTQPLTQELQSKITASKVDKPFVTIPNGWDPAHFPRAGELTSIRHQKRKEILLLHPGSAYRGESLPILRALKCISDAECINAEHILERLRFRFVGYVHPEDHEQIVTSPFSALFEFTPERVSHSVAIQMMEESDVLLLLRKGSQVASSGKVFEYMVAGRPVLAIAEGVAADLVRQSGIGHVVHPEAVEELASTLEELVLNHRRFFKNHYQPNWEVISQYSRPILTQQLALTLDRVIDCTHRR